MDMNIAHVDKNQAQPSAKLGPHMQGDVKVQQLFQADKGNGQDIMLVVFSAGARTRPHIHKAGQILYITDGKGIVATDTERREVTVGDVVIIPPDTWHWHGATPDTPMSHFVLQEPGSDLVWDVDERDWATNY